MPLRDQAFQAVFRRTFVYNILYEDTTVDEAHLGLGPDATVLSISGAGCGVAGYLSHHPRRMDVLDINAHHLSLAALKLTAARHLRSHERFYELLGRGSHVDADRIVGRLLPHAPAWMAPYWRQHARRLQRNLYAEGMTGRMLRAARRELGLDADWLREMARHAPEAREAHLRALLRGVQEHPVVRAALASPVQLLALGVNFTQRDRIVRTHQTHLADYFVEHLVGVLRGFDVETNWFLWYGAAGHFNHDRPDAVPPYLRPEPHAAAVEAPTQISYHHRDLFGVLDEAGPGTWSHFTLLDAVDWMPTPAQRRLFLALRRTARPGARVLWRSVEDEDLVEKLDLPFLRRLPGTEGAAARDRSNQYRRVHVYEIEA